MVKDVEKCQRLPEHRGSLGFNEHKALKSFIGYLEGTGKAAQTIKNYRLDILSFYGFLTRAEKITKASRAGKGIDIAALGAPDLERYHEHLKGLGHKTNTRRRKLLTAHRFLRYLSKRNQLDADIPTLMPTPHKIERIPFTVSQNELLQGIDSLPGETRLEQRNRTLLRLLAETGCLVSEVGRLRLSDIQGLELEISGKEQAQRKIPITPKLKQELEDLGQRSAGNSGFLFSGYNRHGPLSDSMSPRGVELLVKFYSPKIAPSPAGQSPPRLTPRTIRHSVVLAWFQAGLPQSEIQRRLGLKTAYAFRTFAPLLQG
jgi:site-specific recombinase XerD